MIKTYFVNRSLFVSVYTSKWIYWEYVFNQHFQNQTFKSRKKIDKKVLINFKRMTKLKNCDKLMKKCQKVRKNGMIILLFR